MGVFFDQITRPPFDKGRPFKGRNAGPPAYPWGNHGIKGIKRYVAMNIKKGAHSHQRVGRTPQFFAQGCFKRTAILFGLRTVGLAKLDIGVPTSNGGYAKPENSNDDSQVTAQTVNVMRYFAIPCAGCDRRHFLKPHRQQNGHECDGNDVVVCFTRAGIEVLADKATGAKGRKDNDVDHDQGIDQRGAEQAEPNSRPDDKGQGDKNKQEFRPRHDRRDLDDRTDDHGGT